MGGAERMAVSLANVLSEDGIQNGIICTRNTGKLAADLHSNIQLFNAHKKHSLDVFAFIRCVKFIRSFKPDVLHAHSTSIFWAVLFRFFCTGSKVIWHDHYGMRTQLSAISQWPYRMASIGLFGIISVSLPLKEWAEVHLFVKKSRIRYIANFPYLNIPNLNRDSKDYVIVMIANLHEPKDHLNFINAIIILYNKGVYGFKVLLLGKVNDDSDYTHALKQLIVDNNLESLIQFLGEGPAEAILPRVNMGVVSSKSEGLPVSLLEYGLAALPVVVTNVGQCAEVVGHGKYGMVVPPHDPEAMANAIEGLLNHPENAIQMGAAFRIHIEEHYGPKKFLEDYYQLLNA